MPKKVLIIDLDKRGDAEITAMCAAISNKKSDKGYNTYITQARGNLLKVKLPTDSEVTQLVIGGHSQFYRDDQPTIPAKIQFSGKDATLAENDPGIVRHIGGYPLQEVALFLAQALLNFPKLKEIKFYSCESAVNIYTEDKEFRKKNRLVFGSSNSGKKKNNIIEYHIGRKTLDKFHHSICSGEHEKLSNLEILIAELKNYFRKEVNPSKIYPRILFFQGLNGLGYFDEKDMKTRTFTKPQFGKLVDARKTQNYEQFESQCVFSKSTVDKIAYRVNLQKLTEKTPRAKI